MMDIGQSLSRNCKLRGELLGEMKDMNILDTEISISSSMKEEEKDSLAVAADSIIEAMK